MLDDRETKARSFQNSSRLEATGMNQLIHTSPTLVLH